jgi:molecular chaperone GrpE (heat shock protein)
VSDLIEKGAALLRAATLQRREAEKALATATGDVGSVVLAAVESLETLADSIAALDVPEALRPTLRITEQAAWERLTAAGVELDGAPGEDVDLARHRVVKERGGRDVVQDVLARGVTFRGRRIRVAMVTTRRREG